MLKPHKNCIQYGSYSFGELSGSFALNTDVSNHKHLNKPHAHSSILADDNITIQCVLLGVFFDTYRFLIALIMNIFNGVYPNSAQSKLWLTNESSVILAAKN